VCQLLGRKDLSDNKSQGKAGVGRGKPSQSLISDNFLHLRAASAALGESRATMSELEKETRVPCQIRFSLL